MFPDKKLLIKILVFISSQDGPIDSKNVIVNRYKEDVVIKHIEYLYDEKLLSGIDATDSGGADFWNLRLSITGLEYLGKEKRLARLKASVTWLVGLLVGFFTILKLFGVL